MEAKPRSLLYYKGADNKSPFHEWMATLKGQKAYAVILARLIRVRSGLLGDCRTVGMGVWEFRIDFGPGYRVYFGQESDDVVVILNGGSKKTQSSDIASAKVYWKDWNA